MKKMLLAGCSHSAGFGLTDKNLSWGEIFAKNNGHTLTNIAVAASSLQHAIQSIVNEITKQDFDTVILQLTTFDRYPIAFNGENVFLTDDITNVNPFTPEMFHLVPANYLESIEGGNLPINSENIRFFYEKVMYSTFYLNTIFNEIYLLQQTLKHLNVKDIR